MLLGQAYSVESALRKNFLITSNIQRSLPGSTYITLFTIQGILP